MKQRLFSLLLVTWQPLPLLAGNFTEDDERAQLMALLEEQTAIATRTRMNADYVPGMVNVLHGYDLEARGARTVWEALARVPGIETAVEPTGGRKLQVRVRGLGNTLASRAKSLLNDVSMNSGEMALAEPTYNIPVEQVERIVVIRGPGSAVHGEYACMGVINVITRGEGNRVFATGGSFNTEWAGATLDSSSPENPRLPFSPSDAMWPQGPSAGIHGSDRVLPLVNPRALEAAGLRLKPLLLEAAKA